MSSADIPFKKDMDFEYGIAGRVSPLIRRVVCNNPSGFTYHGTNSYIVGNGKVAIIDPGPDDQDHISRLVDAVKGETVTHIVVTHTHIDHSPGAALLKQAIGAPIVGAYPKPQGDERSVEAGQEDFEADQVLADGDTIMGDDWTLEAVFTPGHMSNHHCLALKEENSLFSGDHVMGWNTTIVSPPDGNMKDYFASLDICMGREEAVYWPGHGPEVKNPRPFVRAYLGHRKMREAEISRCLNDGLTRVPEMVKRMYAHLPEKMHWAAGRSVLAHLEHMVETGRAANEGGISTEAEFKPV